MLFAKLKGGLGNILYIISTLYSLSIDNNEEFYVTDYTETCTRRTEESMWLNTMFKKVKKVRMRPKGIKFLYREKGFEYKKIPYRPNLQIEGYFQSSKHFDHNKKQIVEMITEYKNEISKKLDSKFDSDKKKISIHIRRTDYIKLQHAHFVQTEAYYEKALGNLRRKLGFKNIKKLNEEYQFVIFSDDIEWCKTKCNLFKNIDDILFMENNTAIEDIYLMSMCNHHIIANSTFSWWGSYIDMKENSITIAPYRWFTKGYMKEGEWNDIYCKNWIVI
jgi:hypothetical protein